MTAQTTEQPALQETISKLRVLAEEAQALAESRQHAALTHHLLKMGRTLYSAISLTEISPTGGSLDLRNPIS